LSKAGICLGNLASSTTKLLEQIEESSSHHYQNINRLSMLQVLTNIPAGALNVLYGFKGPSMTVSTACASGLSAVIEGAKWIKLKEADFVIVGASEDVYNPLYLNSSIRIQAMTTKAYEKP
jgi:3-oxoacyl-[acyl-carrier-protein] synthase II